MRTTRVAALLSLVLIAAVAVPVTATAATRPRASHGNERVLLTLKPQNRAALRALARSTMTRGSSRAAALAAALPSQTERANVAATARSLGLTVIHTGRLGVLVTGPTALVQRLFGSARSVDASSPVQHPLPTMPAALRGEVTAALGGDDHRPAFRHFAMPDGTADGTDFRTGYGDTVTNPLTPPTPAEQAETIATVQLSGWHSSDLTKYAALLRQSPGNPAWPAPQYTTVDDPLLPSCIATNSNNCPNSVGDDVEVDLDQEAIYATAPYAHQRAYTSGNDFVGMYDSLASIGDDASDPTVDRHIVAASISWGFCETDLSTDKQSSQLYSSFEDVLSYVLATGVTVFASSGDNGGLCDGSKKGVSYPASSPQVVSVGGTQYASSVATDVPQGWVDKGFTPTAGNNPNSFGASGGGVSRVFPLPAYQQAAGIATAGRAVPDVSAMAGDPGFDVVTTSPSGPGIFPVGGTSVASPVLATTYALQVAQHDYSWGVGDILPGLYAQPANFTDVNDQCAAADATCPGWNGVDVARPGYDEVTGLGTPHWSALVSSALGGDPHLTVGVAFTRQTTVPVTVHTADWQNFDRFRVDVDANHVCTVANATATKPTSVTVDDFGFRGLADGVHDLTLVAFNSADNVCHFADAFVFIDTTKPSPTAQLEAGSGAKGLIVRWGGGDAGGSGVKTYRVALATNGRPVFTTTAQQPGSVRLAGARGKSYTLAVTATDQAGNVRTATASLADNTSMSLSGGWSHVSSSGDYAGSSARNSRSGAQATTALTGRAYVLYVTECPACGRLAVYVNGRKVKTVDTYASRTRHRIAVTVYSTRSDERRTVGIRVLGSHSAHSRGNDVYVDAIGSRG